MNGAKIFLMSLVMGVTAINLTHAMDVAKKSSGVDVVRGEMKQASLAALKYSKNFPDPSAPTVYPHPSKTLDLPSNPALETHIYFENLDTFGAAQKLIGEGEDGKKIAVLNFANNTYIGGGFLNGARAQEEMLCRMSNLFNSLMQRAFDKFDLTHYEMMIPTGKRIPSPTYQKWVTQALDARNGALYSPGITVFNAFNKSHNGHITFTPTTPFAVNVISSAAINLGQSDIKISEPNKYKEIMNERMENHIKVAIKNNNDVIVIGAFGCGAFGNDPLDVAQWYKDLLFGKYNGYFKKVVIAIIGDQNDTNGNYRKFVEVFTRQ